MLTQADEARTETDKAGAKEKVGIAVAGSYGEDGFDPKDFKTEIEENLKGKVTSKDGEFPITVTMDGYNFEISDVGVVTEAGKSTSGEEKTKLTDKYGWKVKNYNVQYDCATGLGTSNVWRLFYQDEEYTYLIADELVGNYKPIDYYNKEGDKEKYKDGTKMSILGQKLNERVSSLFTDETKKSKANIRATVWFTDTTNELWTKYKGTNEDAVFSIASPTAELFEASYNNNTNPSHNKYNENKINVQLGDYGYTENTDSGWFKSDDSHGIYNKDDNSRWWLSSPEDRLGLVLGCIW